MGEREWTEISRRQAGVLTRAQVLAAGLTDEVIAAQVVAGRWQRIRAGEYATFTGPLPRQAQLWAAVLAAGSGAVLSHQSAAELWGLVESATDPIHVTVPGHRKVAAPTGVVVHRSGRLDQIRHPTRSPPRTRVEDTVVDLVGQAGDVNQVIGWLTRACALRLTTPQRLTTAFSAKGRSRWRAESMRVLSDVQDGAQSVLGQCYLRQVERAHRLPVGLRQVRRVVVGIGRYDDVRYPTFGTVVELDGWMAHPAVTRWRDRQRDNAALEEGMVTLRYGWSEVVGSPCTVAAQVGRMLRNGGWTGWPRRCSTRCTATDVQGQR